MKAPKHLGSAVIDWYFAKLNARGSGASFGDGLPKASDLKISGDELKLYHESAYELCLMSLWALKHVNDPKDVESWVDVFGAGTRALSKYHNDDCLRKLKELEGIVKKDHDSLRYWVFNSLLIFDSERGRALTQMLGLKLSSSERLSRDYLVIGALSMPSGVEIREEDLQAVIKLINQLPYEFVLKKLAKKAKWLLKNHHNGGTPDAQP